MSLSAQRLLDACAFPRAGASVALAVSGGPDSLGLLLLALEARLALSVHHVDHHARPTSSDDAKVVRAICERLGVTCEVHDVDVAPGANFEARARAERRRVLPVGSLTGHTMDDLAETVLLNMVRGAGVDGLSPMVNDPTKPLRGLRRHDLHEFVDESNVQALHDESNDDLVFRRNRVRHQLLPLMCDVAERDVVPLLARQADVLYEERAWLDELSLADAAFDIDDVDCRTLREWPRARLRRWLRAKLRAVDATNDSHPPSAAEVQRAIEVVVGDVVATQLSGARRLARSGQRLTLEVDSTTLSNNG
ncbi:MAG TPA: tRNA lysidine(34) synthetase TilS [Acidimicrobiales bacterium]|nr:tRNA lysidine(34) synthetase TilS [Acidimicrobiales bacterium]